MTLSDGHRNFIRISWQEAVEILTMELNNKYGAKGEIRFMHDYGTDGISDHYDYPDFVDIYLREK